MLKYFLYLIIIIISNSATANACTVFSFTSSNGGRYLAKSFDWDAVSLVFKRNAVGQVRAMRGDRWQSRYESISLFAVDSTGEHTTGGINSRGLVIEALFCPETNRWEQVLEAREHLTRNAAHQFAWIQRQLDEAKSVQEVVRNLPQLDSYLSQKNPIHYFVCDPTECAVIQFSEGKTRVFSHASLPVEVLTNKPYDEAMQAFQSEDRVLRELGSQGRFNMVVRAAQWNLEHEPIQYAIQNLDRVEVDSTLMKFIYDIENRSVTVKSRAGDRYQTFSLRQSPEEVKTRVLYLYAPPGAECPLNFISE